ncbi:MAG: hypothetical protein VR69_01420 [Peptococcaceae bacterium BRH_c4b]|nr:MAG: hypothetical protein VR69_01420 [Peptococcaceae bacterium BRH_c4b]
MEKYTAIDEKDILMLDKRQQQALSEILISSKSMDGVPRQRVMRVLRTRDEEVFNLFLRKANSILGDALKLVYDEQSNRCVALTRANAAWTQEVLDDHQLALFIFCFYLGMTSRTGRMTFDELHGYFQRSSLYAERKLMHALDHLAKCGLLRMEEYEGEGDEKKRSYYITQVGRQALPLPFLMRIVSESQGGEVTMEQVRDFFSLDRRQEDTGNTDEDKKQLKLFAD